MNCRTWSTRLLLFPFSSSSADRLRFLLFPHIPATAATSAGTQEDSSWNCGSGWKEWGADGRDPCLLHEHHKQLAKFPGWCQVPREHSLQLHPDSKACGVNETHPEPPVHKHSCRFGGITSARAAFGSSWNEHEVLTETSKLCEALSHAPPPGQSDWQN